MRRESLGFTLIDLLVALAVMSVVMAGVVGAFAVQNRTYIQQDLALELQQDLRMGMGLVTDRLRTAGYGVPSTNLPQWFPWVGNFTSNPEIVAGPPDTLSVASCFRPPVATLAADAAQDATILTLTDSAELDAGTRRLILIGDATHAHVKSVAGAEITIDTDPTKRDNQGLSRAYLVGTPVCRVDVLTFSLDVNSKTLRFDENQGDGPLALIEEISDFRITPRAAKQYEVVLTASREVPEGQHGTRLVERSLTSDIGMRN